MPNGSDYAELWMRAPEQIGQYLPGPIGTAMTILAATDIAITDTDKTNLVQLLNEASKDYLSDSSNAESMTALNKMIDRLGTGSTNTHLQSIIKGNVESNVAKNQKGNESSNFGDHVKKEQEINAGKGTGGSLTGKPTQLPHSSSSDNIRSIMRENESAQILANNGYHVEQNPIIPGLKNPDYKINGEIFDNIAPKTNSVRNIYDRALEKINAGQTKSVVINLADTKVSVGDLQKQFNDWPMKGLDKVIVIDQSGKPTRIK